MIIQTSKPLIEWPDPLVELLGFIVSFLASGRNRFPFRRSRTPRADNSDRRRERISDRPRRSPCRSHGNRRRGRHSSDTLKNLPQAAARQHLDRPAPPRYESVSAPPAGRRFLACSDSSALAKVRAGGDRSSGRVGLPLVSLASGDWARAVNPFTKLAAALDRHAVVMLLADSYGPRRAGRSQPSRTDQRGDGAFIFAAGAVGGRPFLPFGVITAWRHLKHLSALWTTPYGMR